MSRSSRRALRSIAAALTASAPAEAQRYRGGYYPHGGYHGYYPGYRGYRGRSSAGPAIAAGVVGVVLGAVKDLITIQSADILVALTGFMLGSTGLVGTVSGDDVALTLQGQYDNKNAGTGKQVDVTAGLLGGVAAAMIGAPSAVAAPDCSASGVAGTVSSTTGAARAYLDSQLAGLQGLVTRLANRLQRRLMAQQNRSWDFDQEEGCSMRRGSFMRFPRKGWATARC